MSGFDYNHFSADFAGRTAKNLNLIYRVSSFQRSQRNNSEACGIDAGHISNSLRRLISIAEDKNCEGFEVTQLLLSIYGMLLVPYEKYKNDPKVAKASIQNELRRTNEYTRLDNKIRELEETGKYRSTYQDTDLVYSFIHHIRNSISHEGIHFLPLESGQTEKIEEILFYDFNAYDSYRNKTYSKFYDAKERFCVLLKTAELKEMIITIAGMYSKIQEHFDTEDKNRYRQEKKDCEDFLQGKI